MTIRGQWMPLTKEEAGARRTRNRQQSPLLHLPGELRNKIYDYAMSDMTLSIFPSSNPRKRFQLHAHLAGGATGPICSLNVLDMTGLTRVCQQVYEETRFLPFQAMSFYVHSDGSFIKFIDMLLDAQRDAISTVQISTPDANAGGTLWHSVKNAIGNDDISQRTHLDLLEWSYNLALDRLGGLKRVVVEADNQWVYKKAGERYLLDGIGSCIRGRDVAVVIPESNGPE